MERWNLKQKIIFTFAVIVFISTTIISFIISLPKFKIDFIRELFIPSPITVFNKTDNTTQKYLYNNEITTEKKNYQISFNSNKIYTANTSSLEISNDSITISSGLFFLDITNPISVNLGQTEVTLNQGVKAIYSSTDQSIIFVSGSEIINNKQVQKDQEVQWIVDTLKIKDFDRSNYTTNYELSSLLITLKSFNVLPDELKYLTPPSITDIVPEDNSIITTSNITIYGISTNAQKIIFENQNYDVENDGSFSINVKLEEGINKFKITAVDTYNNRKDFIITYTKTCVTGNLDNEMICN